jgi:hypothetical protein
MSRGSRHIVESCEEASMPRVAGSAEVVLNHEPNSLVDELVGELRTPRKFGQPLVIETPLPRSTARAMTVVWDKWHPYTDDYRIETVLRAIEVLGGQSALQEAAVVEALTVPEARDAGRLPYRIIAGFPRASQVDEAACRQAMIDCGASTLESARYPELRFPNESMAEDARQHLTNVVPGSEPVWMLAYDGRTPPDAESFLHRPPS